MIRLDDLDAEQRTRLANYWWRRAEGEMTSWIGFRHVLADLEAERMPEPVIDLAKRAVEDEYRHSVFCREWAVRFGHAGEEVRPRSEEAVTFRGAGDEENRLLRITLCCFTETVGCFILRHVRPTVNDTELRKLNRRHLADELRHSRVGWGALAALDSRRKKLIEPWLPGLFKVLPIACCEGPEQPFEELVPFGYFTPRLLRAAHDQAKVEVILPGLEYVGLRSAS
jgi:hypothetical protein